MGTQFAGERLDEVSSTKPGALTGQNIYRKLPDCVISNVGGGLTISTALELRIEFTGLATSTV